MMSLLTLTSILAFIAGPALSIKILDVIIPAHAITGQDVVLKCNYDLQGDKLYSIKWYRNRKEFYRYIPSDNPRTTIFNYPGLNVDEKSSTETAITLRNVDISTTGQFKCEISGEGPLFQTAHSKGVLAVVDLPDEGPIIVGGSPRYHLGERVDINCTSRRSKPAAKLHWFINDEPADPSQLIPYKIEPDFDSLETSVLGLNFKVREKHFIKGNLKLKCTATIASIYWKSNEESVQGVRSSSLISEGRSSRSNSAGEGYSNHFLSAVGNGAVTAATSTTTSSRARTALSLAVAASAAVAASNWALGGSYFSARRSAPSWTSSVSGLQILVALVLSVILSLGVHA